MTYPGAMAGPEQPAPPQPALTQGIRQAQGPSPVQKRTLIPRTLLPRPATLRDQGRARG